VLGRHRGHFHYTVGQRRGLGVHAPEPVYVLRTDARTNTVTVGPREELAVDRVALRGVRLHRGADEVDAVKLRYRAAPVPCRLEGDVAVLGSSFSAPAPGQTAVFLAGDVVVGCATIAR
jgi:tRNA-specific 2-thiouridylase